MSKSNNKFFIVSDGVFFPDNLGDNTQVNKDNIKIGIKIDKNHRCDNKKIKNVSNEYIDIDEHFEIIKCLSGH